MERLTPRGPCLAAALAIAGLAAGDEMAERIRAQEHAFSAAVVWLKMTTADEEGKEGTGRCSGPAIRQGDRTVIVVPDVQEQLSALKMVLPDGREQEAEVLAHDAEAGIMFVAPKGDAKDLSPVALAKGPALALGDPLLLLDRRSPAAPEETTCRLVRVTCVLRNPSLAYFYAGISAEQMGALVVTPAGELVGIVGLWKDRDEEGQERQSAAVLPAERVLESLAAVEKPEPEKKE